MMAPYRPTLLSALLVGLVLNTSVLGAPSIGEENKLEKSKRSFSLFTIVNFPNEQCVVKSDSTMRGVCFSTTECNSKGGTEDGSCASGFGVCCMFAVSTCGGTVDQNCTYIQNPGFPSSFAITASTTCTYRVSQTETNICQLRLDMDNFVISDPVAATGTCTTDTFIVTGPTGRNPPTICGTNTGQHMYIETGMSTTQTTIVFTMDGTTSVTRTFKVKVSQIPCGVNYKAPTDCLQYFVGSSGVTTSFNYGAMIRNQDYSTCVRREMGNCGISWSQTSITTPMAFALDSLDAIVIAAEAPTNCAISYIIIPTTLVTPPKFCGGALNTGGVNTGAQADTTAGAIISNVTPFIFQTFAADADQVNTLDGYSLMWTQIPC